jgi:hypothetical protein
MARQESDPKCPPTFSLARPQIRYGAMLNTPTFRPQFIDSTALESYPWPALGLIVEDLQFVSSAENKKEPLPVFEELRYSKRYRGLSSGSRPSYI